MSEKIGRAGEPVKRLLNCVFTQSICNLRCHYCYVGQTHAHVQKSTPNPHSVEEMRQALSYERMGGRCHMNMCAVGETLLVPEALPLARAFIEDGHMVSLVTNALIGTAIRELCGWAQDYKDNLFVKVSYHYQQLHEKGLAEHFWQDVHLLDAAGISYTIELTVNDESVPMIDDILAECRRETGAACHVIESRFQDGTDWPRLTKLPIEEHQAAWGRFHSSLFAFQQELWGKKRREFCYAGDWIASVNLKTGDLVPCFGGGHVLDNIYAHPAQPIRFQAIGHSCPWGHCYAGYVLLSFGAIPELRTPTYASLRDRVPEGRRPWLLPMVRRSFGTKLKQEHRLYGPKRQAWTNFVMDCRYKNTDVLGGGTDEAGAYADIVPLPSAAVDAVEQYFAHHSYRTAAIYGAGVLGRALARVLHAAGIAPVCYLDRAYTAIHADIPCLPPEAAVKDADVIVVTPYWEADSIMEMLRQKNDLPMASILDIYEE